MGKKLIIKGADFSENGMRIQEVTLNKSDLFNFSGVKITSENFASQAQADRCYYYKTSSNQASQGGNYSTKVFCAKFDIEDYTLLEVSLNFINQGIVGSTGVMFSIAFENSDGVLTKVYTGTQNITGDNIVNIDSTQPFVNQKLNIPSGTKYCYITDRVASAADLTSHSAVLKKYVES